MKCLITGASSGIGKSMAHYLGKQGYELLLVANDSERLKKVSERISNSKVFPCDLSKEKEVDKLISYIKKEKPDIVINNAGFGIFGTFNETDINNEIDMINVNVIAVQKITKACLEYMKDGDHILNVASIAGLLPGGPVLSTYYATKSYIRSYTFAMYEELKMLNKNVHISLLCPGPVNTNFNNVGGGHFSIKSLSSDYVAKYAIDKMFENKLLIIPGLSTKLGYLAARILPNKLVLKILMGIEHKKR